jgi:2-methylisocitrate lyase-like PEP mutase family enzyme
MRKRTAPAVLRARFRDLLQGPRLVICPGVVNAAFARLAERAGFELIYATGAGIANSELGVPDLGLLTMTEQLEISRRIALAVETPVLADIDTGYGGALNVYRTVQEFEAAGLAGVQIEDQVNPKRCGHFNDKQVVSRGEMLERLTAAREARRDPNLVIVGRTDALSTHGVDEAIARANAFVEAGADLIFIEAPQKVEDITRFPREVAGPLLLNMVEGGRTPLVEPEKLEELGYRVALYANTILRVALAAAAGAFDVLHRTRRTDELVSRMLSWDDRQNLVDLDGWTQLDAGIASTAGKVVANRAQ